MTRRRSTRRWSIVLATGAALALAPITLAVALWPRTTMPTSEAFAVHMKSRPTPARPGPASTRPDTTVPPESARLTGSFDDLPYMARRRVEWAHERAAWIDGGWILCDVSHLDVTAETGAVIEMDEEGLAGAVDLATSAMLVRDHWLPLTVRDPVGSAIVHVGEVRTEVRWHGASGEHPGSCEIAPRPPSAHVLVNLVHPDGEPADSQDLVIVGCGRMESTGRAIAIDADAPCTVRVRRHNPWLSTQYVEGPPTQVYPVGGQIAEVDAIVPAAPAVDRLPDLEQTFALLDTAAFSGVDLAEAHLDRLFDDLEEGRFEPDHAEELLAGARRLSNDDIESPGDAVEVAWREWMELDE